MLEMQFNILQTLGREINNWSMIKEENADRDHSFLTAMVDLGLVIWQAYCYVIKEKNQHKLEISQV